MTDEQFELLFTRLAEREADTMDRLTLAVAAGTGIAFGGKEAFDAWQKARSAPTDKEDRINRQNATLARLSAMFPGAVKVVN